MSVHTYVLLSVVVLGSALSTVAQTLDSDDAVINARLNTKFSDCVELRNKGGFRKNGEYYIYPNTTKPIKVLCRFEVNNTFTSIMGQKDGSVSFYQNWNVYRRGFGVPSTNNFWVGLDTIKRLTDIGHRNMRITLQDWQYSTYEIFYRFYIYDSVNYRAKFGSYQGKLIDDFSYNSDMSFATVDRPDHYGCALNMHGGWWYNYCTHALPTGHYYRGGPYVPPGKFADGIFYTDWHGVDYSLMYIRIDLAP